MLNFCKFPARSLVLGYDGIKPDNDFLSRLEKIRPFGIIIFSHNFTRLEDIPRAIEKFRSVVPDMEFLIDQEGGDKCRITKSPYCPPSPYSLRDKSNDIVRQVFRDSAEALAQLGITINLAPVADLGTGLYIRNRTFGTEPQKTAELVVSAMEGIIAGGLKPCVKHFPGLGCADIDPHKKIPVCDTTAQEFENYHWSTFRQSIENGIEYIMTTHILAPSLDAELPATYSNKIITRLRELEFRGKIFTDDLAKMKGAQIFPPQERITRALTAGNDVALWCAQEW
ncbi:hypothetical protein DRQ33_04150 [bacterium]|nr:MAG: hypothetical protein DRQ33_04150 [bacterium]